jgi:hypothetical protein
VDLLCDAVPLMEGHREHRQAPGLQAGVLGCSAAQQGVWGVVAEVVRAIHLHSNTPAGCACIGRYNSMMRIGSLGGVACMCVQVSKLCVHVMWPRVSVGARALHVLTCKHTFCGPLGECRH